MNADECTGYTDGDQDGLGDFCEKNLAAAFAPELYYSHTDETGREPHWVARPASQYDADTVVIGYLLSYYRDAGSQTFGCTLPGAPSDCDGHNGDSEAIFLRIVYNWSTEHWVLNDAWYSEHDSYAEFPAGVKAYPLTLEYPGHPGSYPRVYVSEGKHADYASSSACNSGGTLGSDDCSDVDTAARVVAGEVLNLGSSSHHSASQDCMVSSDPANPYYGSGRQECYWTGSNFQGWVPDYVGGSSASAYRPRLDAFGF